MKTIQEVLILAAEYLQSKSISNPRKEAEDLAIALLKCKRLDLYMRHDQPLMENELARLREWTKRRGTGEPLEYLTGETEFFGVHLDLTPAVLIPRQETEILASEIAEIIKRSNSLAPVTRKVDDFGADSQNQLIGSCRADENILEQVGEEARRESAPKGRFCGSLWDVCCGSGAIGLSLKKKFPHIEVTLSDISKEALEVARRNAEKNQLDVTVVQGDLLSPFAGQKADLIVCNPPYVSENEYLSLDPSVRLYEPKGALVGGGGGLEFYRRLAKQAKAYLKPGGWLCMEIGHTQGEEVLELFRSELWAKRILRKDWSGKDRFVFCLESE